MLERDYGPVTLLNDMNNKVLITLGCVVSLPANAAVLWSIGADDQTQDGDGNPPQGLNDPATFDGAPFNVSGVQETGLQALPGNPANTGGPSGGIRDIDDDYYFAGVYTTVVDGGSYTPVGPVGSHEEYYDRAITNGDPNMRWHFNVPGTVGAADVFTFSIDFYNLDDAGSPDPSSYELTFWVDGVQIGGTQSHTDADLTANQSWTFGLSDIGGAAEQGAGFDHYVEIRSSPTGTARWASLDYVQLEIDPVPEPSATALALLSLLGLGLARRRK